MSKAVIAKSLAGAVAGYALAGFFGVPYLLESVVPAKVQEATKGGNLSVQSASFNPFTFHLSLQGVTFKTPENAPLFSLEGFSINVDPTRYLWSGSWEVGSIVLNGPEITLRRDEKGGYNFAWLSELGGEQPEKAEPSEPPRLVIRHFALNNGSIRYRDDAEGKNYVLDVTPIGFKLDHIDLRDLRAAEGKLRLYASINEGGFVDVRGKIDALSPIRISGNVAFDSGKLYTPWRYFKEKFPIEIADGTAAFGFDYRFDSDDLSATELSRLYVHLDKLRVIPKGENRNLFTLGSLRLREGNVKPMRQDFRAEALELSGITLAAHRSREGKIDWLNYVEEIQKNFPKEERNETSKPWNVYLGGAKIENVGLNWSDDAPAEPYRLSLSNLSLQAGEIRSDPKALLNLSLRSDALRLSRKRDSYAVAGWDKMAIEGIEIDPSGKHAAVEKVSFLAPKVSLNRLKEGSIDLTRYAYAPKSAPKAPPSSSETAWGYRIDEIDLSHGAIRFGDELPKKKVNLNLDQIHLNLKGLRSDPSSPMALALDTRLNEKSTAALTSDLIRSPLMAKGSVTLKGLDAALVDPYLEPSTYASLRRGEVSLDARYHYNTAKTTVEGKVALNDWVLNDTRDNTVLLGWDKIGATPFVYAYPDNRLKINQLAIDGFYANALIDENKVMNFSTLSKHATKEGNGTEPKASGGNPFGLDIVKFLLRGSSATFSDLSLPLPFKTYIHDLEGSVLGISTTKDVTTFVKLRGGVDQYGSAKIDGSLNTKAPKKFTDIKVAFDNLELKGYTPYSLQFLGYKIEGGRLFLDLGYKIDEGKLGASNRVVIRQIELGAEKEGGSPWPMRFVVALLEDSDGVIDIDLPIEGDVNNPDFKYGKVVWQVIGNLFTKAVTSPFRALGSMMGIEGDKLSAIEFEAGSATLSPPEIEKLDTIISMLTKRPKLSLAVYGGWDEVHDGVALKSDKLAASAQKRLKEITIDSVQAIPIDVLEDIAEASLEKKELKTLKTTLVEKYPEEGAFVRHYSDALIEKLVPMQPLAPQELSALGAQRAEAIRNYLIKTPQIDQRLILKASEAVKASTSEAVANRLEIIVP
jgi:hypothetical protein